MVELQRQQGPANGLAQPDAPEEDGIIFSCDLKKMEPKRRTTRLNPETTPATTATTTTTVTNAQLQAMIDQGVTTVLAARDANTNGVDNHNSGTCARRNKTVGNDIAYAMTWTELKKKMTDKYCPRTEIKKLEVWMIVIRTLTTFRLDIVIDE
ncbi:hypothetical protein Tco_0452999 [Tanacetum coccineum]